MPALKWADGWRSGGVDLFWKMMDSVLGLPRWLSCKEPACQSRRHKRCKFDPCVGKVPWGRAWQPTPVFLPGEFPWTEEPGGLQSMGSRKGRVWLSD